MVGMIADANTPSTVQRGLDDHTFLFVCVVMINQHTVIFTASKNIRKARVIDRTVDVGLMTGQCLNTCLGLIVPHFSSLFFRNGGKRYKIITTCDNIRFIISRIVVNTVDSLFMTKQGIIALAAANRPNLLFDIKTEIYLNRTVQTNRCKASTVLRIELYTHDVIGVAFETLLSKMIQLCRTRTISKSFSQSHILISISSPQVRI